MTIWAAKIPPNTTSDVAAAFWYPYKVSPIERVGEWGDRTLAALDEMACRESSGVWQISGYELYREKIADPWWKSSVKTFRRVNAEEEDLPPGYADGFAYEVPFVEMPIYLPNLLTRFHDLNGNLVEKTISSLDEIPAEFPVVVNCTGLGARDLVPDREVFPIRGQVLRVTKPSSPFFWLDEDHPDGIVYIFPRSKDCIVGGTADDNDFSAEPNLQTAENILARACKILPELKDCRVLGHKVGLRPGRSAVRLEKEMVGDRVVIHNYGHGGAGITLSWGCADEVVDLVNKL